jgi:hypothetical protein
LKTVFVINCEEDAVSTTTTVSPNDHHRNMHHKVKQHSHDQTETLTQEQQEQLTQPIFINQSNNMYILAKYGQTINLPCVIVRLRNPDLANVHAIWHKLAERQRPQVLSIGLQQLKQDLRYRVKVTNVLQNKSMAARAASASSNTNDSENSNIRIAETIDASSEVVHHLHSMQQQQQQHQQLQQSGRSNKHIVQNWSFEIRKLTYEDSGTYQCLLPLVKPITKNITLQVIRKFKPILLLK